MKKCGNCKRTPDEVPFGTRIVQGKRYLRHLCKPCHNADRHYREGPEAGKIRQVAYAKRCSLQRRALVNVEKWIYRDARATDRKRGLLAKFDLTIEFIRALIAGGCEYCGEIALRMTLDRIENDLGHTKDNVKPACIRCNYIRRNIPYEAWLLLVPGVRNAVEQKKFGDWTGRCR
jgi:hypothetical protein